MNSSIDSVVERLRSSMQRLVQIYHPNTFREKGLLWRSGVVLTTLIVIMLLLNIYWSQEPDIFDIRENTALQLEAFQAEPVTGSYTTASLIQAVETLLEKPGGYLSNDVIPPSLFMDNMPNWEYGVLIQSRDLARSLRNDFSRSQSQSRENPFLANAEPHLNFTNTSWIFPASESEYQDGLNELRSYLGALSQRDDPNTQFYARADNLRDWLAIVEKRLGNLSQQLSASVGQDRINTDLAGDPDAAQSTQTSDHLEVRTPWTEIDDVFYQARGSTWALIHFLHAVEIDFHGVLKKKNALVSLRQIIRELEATQQSMTSPVILNGKGFGVFANYSLVMASYISRANAAVIDLRNLLSQG